MFHYPKVKFGLALVAWWTTIGQSFVHHASPMGFRQHKLLQMAISTAPTKISDAVLTPREWEFQGHKCYSEVVQPNGGLPFSKSKADVILIHGFGCSTLYWRETVRSLTQAGYTVHALDLLGQGKSAKPGRAQGVEYSIDLWANLVDDYAKMFIKNSDVVVVGNSLGSVVALAAATGDFASGDEATFISSKIAGVGMFNCGVGMNSRNLLRDPSLNIFQKTLFTLLFDLLDALVFGNVPLLTYALDKIVTKELLKNALVGLYACAVDPEGRVDDALVDSFYLPAKDVGSPEALSQIYTNDAGRTPMEIHEKYKEFLQNVPFQIVWGSEDNVTPLAGPVGQFYAGLAEDADCKVSMNVVRAGHVPFDEVPECNEFLVEWLDETVSKQNRKEGAAFRWPFSN